MGSKVEMNTFRRNIYHNGKQNVSNMVPKKELQGPNATEREMYKLLDRLFKNECLTYLSH